MDDSFHGKVHAAAVAAWWTLLIAAAFLTLQWLAFLGIMAARPAWVVSLWGPGETWESIRTIWFQALLFLKVTLWPLVLAALWLTFWARQLRKSPRSA
jgi:hypothetical protein